MQGVPDAALFLPMQRMQGILVRLVEVFPEGRNDHTMAKFAAHSRSNAVFTGFFTGRFPFYRFFYRSVTGQNPSSHRFITGFLCYSSECQEKKRGRARERRPHRSLASHKEISFLNASISFQASREK